MHARTHIHNFAQDLIRSYSLMHDQAMARRRCKYMYRLDPLIFLTLAVVCAYTHTHTHKRTQTCKLTHSITLTLTLTLTHSLTRSRNTLPSQGDELVARHVKARTPIGGFLGAARELNVDVVPCYFAIAEPSGATVFITFHTRTLYWVYS